MAARDEQQPYEGGGGGAGGKFRKRPLRRSTHTTPYDRPSPAPATLAFRNPNGGGGWFSKLVDPAQRLITSGAHRLFASVFRKRLPPPEPASTQPETMLEAQNKLQEAVATDIPGVPKDSVGQGDGPSHSTSRNELTDIEQVLKQKTFTRSEIDRLTALLNSKTVGLANDKGKRPEVVPLEQAVSTDREEGLPRTPAPRNRVESEAFPKTPATENRIENQLVSTSVVNATVHESEVASPTELVELAKSYMHKKPTSPPMLGFRNQAMVENSSAMYTRNIDSPSRLPFTPIVPRIMSGHTEARENGFITPRSRGRSAIYNMARTPYSRVHPAITSKGVENAIDVNGSASSSFQSAQGALKRRSSVLENDIGSFGAIRRIRQKPNLLSSRSLSRPISGTPLASSGTGFGSEATQGPSSSRLKPFGEPSQNAVKPSAEHGDKSMSITTVPSKSSEMASKILQQLDKLVSPKDKPSEPKALALVDQSPSKLSTSMLRGQALKSLEHVDSSKFLGEAKHKTMDVSPEKVAAVNAQPSTSLEQGKVQENGPLKLGSSHYKFTSKVNGSAFPKENGEDSMLPKTDAAVETPAPASSNFVKPPPPKKRGFQMSALEDFVDLDEDSLPNGTASDSLAEGRRKVSFALAEKDNSATEFGKLEKASASTEFKPVASETNQKNGLGTFTGPVTAKNGNDLVFQNASLPGTAVLPSVMNTESSVSPPAFNFSGKIVSAKDANATSPTVNFGLKSADKAQDSQGPFSSSATFSFVPSDSKPETSSNLSTVTDGATDSQLKLPEPNKADMKNNETQPPSTSSTPSANTFFSSTLTNGPSILTSSAPVVFKTLPGQSSSGSSGNNTSAASTFPFASSTICLSSSNSTPLMPPTSVFKPESPVPTTTDTPHSSTTSALAPVSETSPAPAVNVFKLASSTSTPTASVLTSVSKTSDAALGAIKTQPDVSVGKSTLFAFTSSTSSTSANQSQSAQAALAGTEVSTFPQNVPYQFGSSVSSLTSGLAGSSSSTSASVSASSAFGSNLDVKSFSPVTASGLGSSLLETNSGSSSSSSAPSVFGTTWQQPKPPVFSFTSSPSTGFSFTASSTSATTTSSSPSTVFPFSASSTAASSAPSTGFSFGSSSAPTVAANSSMSSGFSFGSSTPSATTNSSPSTGFTFGASSTSASSSPSLFGVSAPSNVTNGAPMVFGLNGVASSSSPFAFNSPSTTTTTQAAFGNPNPGFSFGSTPVNNDQMSMEDSMAEDTVQTSAPGSSLFGQPQPVPQSSSAFTFGSATSGLTVGSPYQFGTQSNLANPQNPFQATGSLGSNFSMGSGGSGADKSNRKFIKVKHKQRKK